ncbi:MAG: hypothetical protein JKY15_05380 [Deltaproteobacteria bacterium]|nr:hypothetical protein [Deltaproteobacteria bacterium]
MLFLDIGLLQNANQINADLIFEQELTQINQGALAEDSNSRQLDDGLCHPGLEPGSSPCATFPDPGSVPGMTKQRR